MFAVKKDVPYLTDMLEKFADAQDICIIGGGFIGVEIAEECRVKLPEATITIVEMLSHCLQLVYDEECSVLAEEKLKAQNIGLQLDAKVEAIQGKDKAEGVKLSTGQTLKADLVILGIGAKAQVSLAKQAGLSLGPTGSVQVNKYMQTTDESIFACGDCAEKLSFFDGAPPN